MPILSFRIPRLSLSTVYNIEQMIPEMAGQTIECPKAKLRNVNLSEIRAGGRKKRLETVCEKR
jgi:hypothetical protein